MSVLLESEQTEREPAPKKPKTEGIFSLLNAVGQLILASILWVVCCLPVITIGAASAALYYSVVKTIRRERTTIVKSFFHAFKTNFRQGLWLNLLLLAYGGAVALLALPHISSWTAARSPDVTLYVCAGLALLAVWIPPYLYPALSRFCFSIGQLFRFTLVLGVRYFFRTVLLTLLLAAFVAFAVLQPVFLILLPGLYAWGSSFLLEPVFKKHSEQEGSAEYETWYSK